MYFHRTDKMIVAKIISCKYLVQLAIYKYLASLSQFHVTRKCISITYPRIIIETEQDNNFRKLMKILQLLRVYRSNVFSIIYFKLDKPRQVFRDASCILYYFLICCLMSYCACQQNYIFICFWILQFLCTQNKYI